MYPVYLYPSRIINMLYHYILVSIYPCTLITLYPLSLHCIRNSGTMSFVLQSFVLFSVGQMMCRTTEVLEKFVQDK